MFLEIKQLTAINAHSEAVVALAKIFGNENEIEAAEKILEVHLDQGYMTKVQTEIRKKLMDRLLDSAENMLRQDAYNTLVSCL